jgi:hypothetical protein
MISISSSAVIVSVLWHRLFLFVQWSESTPTFTALLSFPVKARFLAISLQVKRLSRQESHVCMTSQELVNGVLQAIAIELNICHCNPRDTSPRC